MKIMRALYAVPGLRHRVSPVPRASQELLSDEVIEHDATGDLAQSEQAAGFAERESFAQRFSEGTEHERNELCAVWLATRTARDPAAITGKKSPDGRTRPLSRTHRRIQKCHAVSAHSYWGFPEQPGLRPRGVVVPVRYARDVGACGR
jgi:hypothetical protein